MKDGRTEVGDVIHDWTRGDLVVVSIIRPEQLGRYSDGLWRRGSSAERCALHGGQTRPQPFEVRD